MALGSAHRESSKKERTMTAVSKSQFLIWLEWEVLSVDTHVTEGVLRRTVSMGAK
jgi:methionine-rich copper-binding protein CopC